MWYVGRDTVNCLQHTITHYTPSGKKNLMAGYNEAPAFKSIHLDVVATWNQVIVFFPIGVQLTKKKKKSPAGPASFETKFEGGLQMIP